MSRVARGFLLATLAVGPTLAGCHAYRPATAPVPAGSLVRIHLDPPREIALAAPGRDSVRVANVRSIDGRLLERRRDTLVLRARSVRAEREALPRELSDGVTVAVVPSPTRPLEVRQLQRGRTVAAIGGTFVATLLVLSLIAFSQGFGY